MRLRLRPSKRFAEGSTENVIYGEAFSSVIRCCYPRPGVVTYSLLLFIGVIPDNSVIEITFLYALID